MSDESIYILTADLLLIVHVLFVAFVVFGLVVIYIGAWLSWPWVRNFWFRILHLMGIGVVVLQSWAGVICPLTIWEMELRKLAGQSYYEGSFIQHWLHALLYYEAPAWVFMLVYTVFGILVAASWFVIPPIRKQSQKIKE